jgi:hypothetical protein
MIEDRMPTTSDSASDLEDYLRRELDPSHFATVRKLLEVRLRDTVRELRAERDRVIGGIVEAAGEHGSYIRALADQTIEQEERSEL